MLPQMTSALLTSYTAPIFDGLSVSPSSVVSALPLASSAVVTWPLTTWYLRILASSAGLCILVLAEAGSFAAAGLGGAQTGGGRVPGVAGGSPRSVGTAGRRRTRRAFAGAR